MQFWDKKFSQEVNFTWFSILLSEQVTGNFTGNFDRTRNWNLKHKK